MASTTGRYATHQQQQLTQRSSFSLSHALQRQLFFSLTLASFCRRDAQRADEEKLEESAANFSRVLEEEESCPREADRVVQFVLRLPG